MQTDFTDKNFKDRMMCSYCKLPINKCAFVLINEKIYFFRLVNHPVHPECIGGYIDSWRNKVLSFMGIIIGLIALGLAVISLLR